LRESHIDLVRDLITASKRTKIRRFIHISTAFCSGYVDGELREALHPEPASDPTEYTRFKRSAEWLVAESGVPYIILRPSIVIGDSRDGWYSGQPIGVYQLWSSFAKILMDRYRRRLHFVAQRRPLHFLHQDAFTASVLAARKGSEAGTIAHLVSAPDRLPTGEDFCRLWCEHVARPHEVNIYRELADVPVKEIDFSYRKWLEFTSINTQISSHDWIFERRYLDKLIGNGLAFPDVSVDTFGKCLNRFVSTSDIIKKYHDKFYSNFP
jgi:nucleoside-diphosphate-sugar epimerase